MPSEPIQSGIIPLNKAIDHYFELALYLLVLTGFATLASTGELDLASMLVVGVVLLVRGYLLAKKRGVVIGEQWTTPLTIAYFVFFAADYFVFSRGFLPATIHLALFGVAVRMFSLRRERDHVMLAILAFLMVLAASVLTVDSAFLFWFGAFMLMAVATFVLMEMRRSGQEASIRARHTNDPQEHRHLAFALVRVAPFLMLLILVGGSTLFFILPRMSAGYMGAYAFGTDLTSGFSDHVQLGQIGHIQQSNAVVMHVRVEDDRVGRYDLYWRGVALADFDGHIWSNSREQYPLRREGDSFLVPRAGEGSATYGASSPAREQIIHYRVLMEPIGTNVLFLTPWAWRVSGNYRLLAADLSGAVYDVDVQHPVSQYEADSDIAKPTAAELRTAGRKYPVRIAASYLQLPPMDPRIPKLAAEIVASAGSDYEKATAIDEYLKSRYGYTLELQRSVVADPIADFLFVRKQGHCEYFASSMAVMLRTLGIPTRVVNGFHSDEYNDLTANYVVRAKNAHSWVEAYFPGYGWQTFDPTPGSATGTPQGWSRMALYFDAMASFWREWVVSYDISHQYVLGQTAVTSTRGVWERARAWARERYEAMLKWAERSQQRFEHSPGKWAVLGTVVAVALVLLGNLGRFARFLHEKSLRAYPERSPQQAAAMWYARMARILARRGVKKPAAETAREFVRKIEDLNLREPVARFTEVYESARFGNSADDARRLPELYEEVESASEKR
jgi:protein-glutamine gamma-glutamyltransferase